MWRTILASGACLVLGGAALSASTNGFRAFTAEGARRLAVLHQPVAIPNARLVGSDGVARPLADQRGRIVLVEFIFTSCPLICQEMGQAFRQVMERVRRRGLERDVALLSISFDIDHDTPEQLANYAELHGAEGTTWRVVAPRDQHSLSTLLESFGVIVLADPLFKFQHNAAVHILDRRGRLVRIVDTSAAAVMPALLAELGQP